jgi:hypothetical protein
MHSPQLKPLITKLPRVLFFNSEAASAPFQTSTIRRQFFASPAHFLYWNRSSLPVSPNTSFRARDDVRPQCHIGIPENTTPVPRRPLIVGALWTALTTFSAPAALAAIDVRGLRLEGGGRGSIVAD